MAGWQAFANQKAVEADTGNIRLGPAAMRFNAGIQIAYDTNINSSETDPIGDLSLIPGFSIGIHWPITRQNELDLQLGLQYRRYLFHPEYAQNAFVIDPGTALEYHIFTGDFVFTVYDTPAITTDPGNDPGVFNTINFQQLQNTAGLSILHDLNTLLTTVGVMRADVRSLSGTYASNNRTTYSIYGNTFYSITPTTRIGLRGDISSTSYSNNTLNDYVSALGGVIFTSNITPLTSYHIEVGVQSASYSATGTPQDSLRFTQRDGFNEDVTGTLGGGNYVLPYFEVEISSRLTRHIQHSLTFSREAQPSTVSNYVENTTIGYRIEWALNRIATISLDTVYTRGTVSSSTTPISYVQWNSNARLALEIARDTSVTFFYDYLVNDMAASNASYDRSRFGVSLYWAF